MREKGPSSYSFRGFWVFFSQNSLFLQMLFWGSYFYLLLLLLLLLFPILLPPLLLVYFLLIFHFLSPTSSCLACLCSFSISLSSSAACFLVFFCGTSLFSNPLLKPPLYQSHILLLSCVFIFSCLCLLFAVIAIEKPYLSKLGG